MAKQLWVIAGGNGAGKSRFYEAYLKPHGIFFVNADILARKISERNNARTVRRAQELARAVCNRQLEQGATFCFETVFSHESKIDLIRKAKSLGYTVILIFIHLNHPTLNVARVFQRVQGGGHAVPEAKIRSRIPRTLENIRKAIPLVDQVRILDNSSTENPHRQVAKIVDGKVVERAKDFPKWANDLLK